MKIVEDYAQRKVDEKSEEFVINLSNEGYGIEDIVRITNVSPDFVKKILSK
ncbi:helix-turn-helix domain-containing protein [Methanobrevibacter sp.]|uniref:helix-turn-helix domain-containing protein n=1 Tax=Methanobrevibacter sp. TaxID=66852 RepID=UPI00386A8F35